MDEEAVIFRVPSHLAPALERFVGGDAAVDISLNPAGTDGLNFIFTLRDESGTRRFPAKFASLPTTVEIQKTADHVHLVKAGMISRVLVVYEQRSAAAGAAMVDEELRTSAETIDVVLDPSRDALGDVCDVVADPTPGSSERVLDSGLTPPMQHAVRRRFRKAQRYIGRYEKQLVEEAERVLLDLTVHDAYEHCVEELVDAEPFMAPWFRNGGDNVTICYEDGIVKDMYQLQPNLDPAVYPDAIFKRVIMKNGELPAPKVVAPNADGSFGVPPGHAAPPQHHAGRRAAMTSPAAPATAAARSGHPAGAPAAAAAPQAAVLFDDGLDLLDDGGALGENAGAAAALALDSGANNLDYDFSELLGEESLGLGLDADDLGDALTGGASQATGKGGLEAAAADADSHGIQAPEAVQSLRDAVQNSAAQASLIDEHEEPNALAPVADAPAVEGATAEPEGGAPPPVEVDAAASEARLTALVEAHPEGQRLAAELTAASAGAAKVAEEVAQAQRSASLAKGIKALRDRWEADAAAKGRKLAAFETRVTEAREQLQALRDSLRMSL